MCRGYGGGGYDPRYAYDRSYDRGGYGGGYGWVAGVCVHVFVCVCVVCVGILWFFLSVMICVIKVMRKGMRKTKL